MHVVIEFLDASPGNSARLRAALLLMARATLEKKIGCHVYDVGQDEVDGGSFLLYQAFDTKAAYLAHLERIEYAEHRILVEPWVATRRTLTYDLITSAGIA
jgi:quinol monooxygenase YgiN